MNGEILGFMRRRDLLQSRLMPVTRIPIDQREVAAACDEMRPVSFAALKVHCTARLSAVEAELRRVQTPVVRSLR
jgi:hypothetical protein